jgi:hypothetical protein
MMQYPECSSIMQRRNLLNSLELLKIIFNAGAIAFEQSENLTLVHLKEI